MADWLYVRNWERWQTYRKDRGRPPWIKLYQSLLMDYEFITLSDTERGQLVVLWLLASEQNGKIPADEKQLHVLGRFTEPFKLQTFIDKGFFTTGDQVVTTRLPDGNQLPTNVSKHDRTDTDTETETETEPLTPSASAHGEKTNVSQCSKSNPIHNNCRACGTNKRATQPPPEKQPRTPDEWQAWGKAHGDGGKPGESMVAYVRRLQTLYRDKRYAH